MIIPHKRGVCHRLPTAALQGVAVRCTLYETLLHRGQKTAADSDNYSYML